MGGPAKPRRGQRTRESLVQAALEVFARDGFFDAKMSDITAAANLANGTFYTYFTGKLDIFHEAASRILTASAETAHGERGEQRDPVRELAALGFEGHTFDTLLPRADVVLTS